MSPTTSNVDEGIKQEVREYWNLQSCGTQFTDKEKFTKEYYDEIERHRYDVEPEIFAFAQFTRHHKQKMLEVGVGAGTDFTQWIRAGVKAYGIDLTPEGVDHVLHRLEVYGLKAEEVRVADCENIPYDDNSFDLVYSLGVIHHTPNTPKAFSEIARVCRPGGTCKVMIYHRHSLVTYRLWIQKALLKGRPWKSLSWCLYHHMESIGTKAYTRKEARQMLADLPVDIVRIYSVLTYYDVLGRFNKVLRAIGKTAAWLLGGNRVGWFMMIEFTKRS